MWGRLQAGTLGYQPPNASSKKLILSILNSTATKREARDYLTKYADSSKRVNHCLLLARSLHRVNEKTILQLSEAIKSLRMLGLRPICMIPPSGHVIQQAESLDRLISAAQLQPLHLQNGLTKDQSGQYESILASHVDIFGKDEMANVVPIIRPFVFDESSATEYIMQDSVKYTNYLCQGSIPYIDKFFILNTIGGIPSGERNENSHVFINLNQEYDSLSKTLKQKFHDLNKSTLDSEDPLGRLNFHAREKENSLTRRRFQEHLEDLQLMNAVLSNLSISSTGLITTINAASLTCGRNNPLLYNLLTDRSLISSSLPRFKKRHESLRSIEDDHSWYELPDHFEEENSRKLIADDAVSVTTVLKRGVQIKIFDASTLTQNNSIGLPGIFHDQSSKDLHKTSHHKKLDLTKLKHILDQSFGRELDLNHYLARINGKIASVIVIGDYEGIAILTYEGPSENPFVYLDKFAVLPHLKGSLGISDIIFNLMFKKFPKELLWRSRTDNVVNKWYFQRSVGVMDLSIDLSNGDRKPSQFKLFYYGNPEAADSSFRNHSRLKQYAKYIRDISPSWMK